MATAAVDGDEDVLTCTVCLDSYTDPCTLQCKHSFCRKCIRDYVRKQADAEENKTIPCPSCRQVTRVPDPSRPVDEWTGQLQPGHAILELMATVDKETIIHDAPCFPCQQLGETTPGVFWCSECEAVFCQRCAKTHSVMPNNRDHDLCDLKDKGRISSRKPRCKKHKEKIIECYCKNCNVSHCALCSVENHWICKDVVTIKSFISEMKLELSELNKQFEDQELKSSSIVGHHRTKITQLNKDMVTVIEEVQSISQKAVDLIKEKEKKIKEGVKEIVNKEVNELKANAKQGNIQMQTYRQYREYIKQALSSDSEGEVCDVYQVWKSGQMDISQEGTVMGGGNISSIRFSQPTPDILGVLDNQQMGKIVTFEPFGDRKVSFLRSDSVVTQVENNEKAPDIHDVTVLEIGGVHTIVATDCNNFCVKSFLASNSKKCYSRLCLNHAPRGLTQLENNKVMVAVPTSKQIVIVAVTPDLVFENHIDTGKKYYSLSVMKPSTLAAGGNECVDILNMQGRVMKSVTTYRDMQLFSSPRYMCVNSMGNLLVTDWKKKTVTCLLSDGRVLWVNSDRVNEKKSFLTGITTTKGGVIIVADSDSKKVMQLSLSGEYVRDLLTSEDGLLNPMGICVDKHGSLFVCNKGRVYTCMFARK